MRILILSILLLSFYSIQAATLPSPYDGDNNGWYSTEVETSPNLEASYNLWELGYTTSNLNNDYLWIFPINDRLYAGDFYVGDEIHYNSGNPGLFYTLSNTSINGWLTYDMRDADADGIVEGTEMELVQNRFFEKGEETPLDNGLLILFILACIYLFSSIKLK